jgi:hypothetical protein
MKSMLACVFVLCLIRATSAAQSLNLNLFGLQDNGSNESEYDLRDTKYKKERILFKTLLNLWHDTEFLALHNLQKEIVLDSFRIFARRRGIESKRVLNLIKMMKDTFSLNF